MKRIMLIAALFCMFLLPLFVTTGEANAADAGWVICDVVRIGTNAQHGYAYLELTSAGPHAGIFSNHIFALDQSIRKEAMAAALTALSLGEYLRVLVTTETNTSLSAPLLSGCDDFFHCKNTEF
jgi:hypothetical protein